MIHNTYRRLDESSLQIGPLSLPQWLLIAAIGGLMFALKQLTGMPTQAVLCVATVAMGGPFAAMVLSEGGRPSYMRLIRDALSWALSAKVYSAGGGTPRPCTLKLTQHKRASRGELPAPSTKKELAA